ncbi:MAG: HAMP domain-containing sensor histidine kinase [Sideroxydans sp.]|nr:HAMP domain-containing sensor histidine kinase [Sideroxydans sp.]
MLANLAAKLSLDINDENLAIRAAQIRARLGEYVLMVASQMVLAVLMVWLMWDKVAHFTLLCWIGLLYSAHALEIFFWWRHRQHTRDVRECQHWRNRFLIFTSFSGAVMGSAAVLMFVPNDTAYQALLICIILGLSAGAVTVNPVYPASMYLYTLLLMLPLLFSTLRVGDATHTMLGAMLLLYLLFILHTGYGLARTFALSLQRSEENVTLVLQLIEEKKTANAARQIAEQSNLSKSKFLAAASHDLRQPMHALSLFVEALKSHISDRSGTAILTQVEHSVDVLGQMLDALLDVSRLDSGVIAPHYAQFSVQQLFSQLRNEFAATAQEKKLHWQVAPCEVVVYSDALLLERILRNLLSNALRYTVQGEVSLRAYVIDTVLQIEVADTGIGIASKHLPQIFDEYFQVGNEQRDRKQGLGLGLAIVQRLSQLLHCQLQVESTLGVGTRFSLKVPLQLSNAMIKDAKKSNQGSITT